MYSSSTAVAACVLVDAGWVFRADLVLLLKTHLRQEHGHPKGELSYIPPPPFAPPLHLPARSRVRLSAPQLPRPAPASAVASSSSSSTTAAGLAAGDVAAGSGGKSKRNKKKRARPEDNSTADEDESAREMAVGGDDDGDGDDNAGRIYQAWLEARYVDFLRVLLGWIAEVDDFHRQVISLSPWSCSCSCSCLLQHQTGPWSRRRDVQGFGPRAGVGT